MRKAIFGSLGSAFAAACYAGVPAVLGALSAAGLGFLVNDLILFPLLVLFLGLGLWGLWDGVARHGLRQCWCSEGSERCSWRSASSYNRSSTWEQR